MAACSGVFARRLGTGPVPHRGLDHPQNEKWIVVRGQLDDEGGELRGTITTLHVKRGKNQNANTAHNKCKTLSYRRAHVHRDAGGCAVI